MTNATARVAERNPSPSLAYSDEVPPEALVYAEHASRLTAPHNDDAVAPAEPGVFFRNLRPGRATLAINGADWSDSPRLGHPDARLLATAEKSIYGLEGLLDLLRASEAARATGESEEALSERLIDQLHVAARALACTALDSMCLLREQIGVEG